MLFGLPGVNSARVDVNTTHGHLYSAQLTRRLSAFVTLAALFTSALFAQGSPSVVISQVYGGGGNAGTTPTNDFIELFNRGSSPVDLTGWSVQYASASGTSWDRTLLSGTLQPGQYYLVQEAQGNAGTQAPPAPDAVGGINLSATSGKVALANDSNVLSGSRPVGSKIIDFLGYGTANGAENSAASSLSNTTAAVRNSSGCTDTDNNGSDFATGAPNPRNSASTRNPCQALGPLITKKGILSSASYQGNAVSPGEILVIFGSNLGPPDILKLALGQDGRVSKQLGPTRVLFDGIPGPMIYALDRQVSAIAPYSIAGKPGVTVQVEMNGVLSNGAVLPVAATKPAVFSQNQMGTGQGAILNQDFSVNGSTNAAAAGSVVQIFMTGGGILNLPGNDGEIDSGSPLRHLAATVTVKIGGIGAVVQYAGAAPSLVLGVVQVNAFVPAGLPAGSASIEVTIGGIPSPAGTTLAVSGSTQSGTGALIEQKLSQLKQSAAVPPLVEIPTDFASIPANWLALVSWNTQVGATSTSLSAERPPMVRAALATMFSGTYQLLAAQEVPSTDSADFLRTLLPGGTSQWNASFFDTTDTMDNGFWFRSSITLRDSFDLFVTNQRDSSGRLVTDPTKALHPPQVAQFQVGDFDFTLITVHLTFADGDATKSAAELGRILDYLDWYFDQPDHDPDVIVCGDFNIPSLLSGETASGGVVLDSIFDNDPRFQVGERRFVVTVHDPTSRNSAPNGGMPVSNYDHCVLSADTMKEFVEARRVSPDVLTDSPEDPEVRLTSDHFPIVAFFRTSGPGISLDMKTRIRPTTDAACCH